MSEMARPPAAYTDFIGHRALVRRIFSRIGTERPQSISLIGGRKTGKTSLLNFMMTSQAQGEYLQDTGQYSFCLINSEEEGDSANVATFIGRILTVLDPTVNPGDEPYNVFQRVIEDLHFQQKKVVLLFDNFHFITKNPNFPFEFFSFLRSLANNFNLAYVTTSYLELQNLCVIKDVEESPFFNIFTNLSLGFWEVTEAQTFLNQIAPQLTADERDLLVLWCGPSAYLLKTAVALLGQKEAPPISEQSLEELLLPHLADYYGQIMAILKKDAFVVLKDLVKGKQPHQKNTHAIRSLEKQGFLQEGPHGGLSCFADSLTLFIKKRLKKKQLAG